MKTIFTEKTRMLTNTLKLLTAGAFSLARFNAGAQTTTCSYTGAVQTYTVPVGVTSIQLES